MLLAAALTFQVPVTPEAATPAGASLPSKGKVTPNSADSELEGHVKEDGVMSFVRYEGGSFPLKLAKATTYVNRKEVVMLQGKQRFAIPVKAVAEILEGNAVHARVSATTGNGILTAGMKNQSPGNLTVIGIVWTDPEKKNGIVLRVDKGDFAAFVSALESVTGLKAVNTDPKNR